MPLKYRARFPSVSHTYARMHTRRHTRTRDLSRSRTRTNACVQKRRRACPRTGLAKAVYGMRRAVMDAIFDRHGLSDQPALCNMQAPLGSTLCTQHVLGVMCTHSACNMFARNMHGCVHAACMHATCACNMCMQHVYACSMYACNMCMQHVYACSMYACNMCMRHMHAMCMHATCACNMYMRVRSMCNMCASYESEWFVHCSSEASGTKRSACPF